MFLVPCPGLPGLTLYLKSPVSKAMRLVKAAISPEDVIPYVANEELIAAAAWLAVRHSFGFGAPAHMEEVGAMVRICPTDTLELRAPVGCEREKGIRESAIARRILGTMVDRNVLSVCQLVLWVIS